MNAIRLPSGVKRAVFSARSPAMSTFGDADPSEGTTQISELRFPESRAVVVLVKMTRLPSGEMSGSLTRMAVIKSSMVMGRFACAIDRTAGSMMKTRRTKTNLRGIRILLGHLALIRGPLHKNCPFQVSEEAGYEDNRKLHDSCSSDPEIRSRKMNGHFRQRGRSLSHFRISGPELQESCNFRLAALQICIGFVRFVIAPKYPGLPNPSRVQSKFKGGRFSMKANASDILVDVIHDWGVDVVFGLPGDGINGIMEALRKRADKIRFVQV